MAKVILAIPEYVLGEVISIIRSGIGVEETYYKIVTLPSRPKVSRHACAQLAKWCDEHEEYLEMLERGDDGE